MQDPSIRFLVKMMDIKVNSGKINAKLTRWWRVKGEEAQASAVLKTVKISLHNDRAEVNYTYDPFILLVYLGLYSSQQLRWSLFVFL